MLFDVKIFLTWKMLAGKCLERELKWFADVHLLLKPLLEEVNVYLIDLWFLTSPHLEICNSIPHDP